MEIYHHIFTYFVTCKTQSAPSFRLHYFKILCLSQHQSFFILSSMAYFLSQYCHSCLLHTPHQPFRYTIISILNYCICDTSYDDFKHITSAIQIAFLKLHAIFPRRDHVRCPSTPPGKILCPQWYHKD